MIKLLLLFITFNVKMDFSLKIAIYTLPMVILNYLGCSLNRLNIPL